MVTNVMNFLIYKKTTISSSMPNYNIEQKYIN
jgi:hypothetical protein